MTDRNICGSYIANRSVFKSPIRAKDWEAIFRNWVHVIEAYCEDTQGWSPYWHLERTNIGLLAIAAWKRGYSVLEEFSHKKKDGNAKKNGRADLMIGRRKEYVIIEAKQYWKSLLACDEDKVKAENKLSEWLKKFFREATPDIKKSKEYNRSAAGIVFVVFKSEIIKGEKCRTPSIKNMIKMIRNELQNNDKNNFHAVAWCFPFPKYARQKTRGKNYYYPGIMILLRCVNPHAS